MDTLIEELEVARRPGFRIALLDVRDNRLGRQQFEQLFEVLDSVPVDELRLSGCTAIGSDGTKLLAKWLRSREDALLELHASECGITSQGFGRLLDAIKGNAVFPRVDPATQMPKPVLLRVERNFITEDVVLQRMRSGMIECCYKRDGKLIHPPVLDGVKVHLFSFWTGEDYVLPQKMPPVEAPEEERHNEAAPVSACQAFFEDRGRLDELVWQQLEREQLRPPVRAKIRRFFVAALRAATSTQPGQALHEHRVSGGVIRELLGRWVDDACTRLHASLAASPLEGVEELSPELLARVVEAVFRGGEVPLPAGTNVVEMLRERWEALGPQLALLPASPEPSELVVKSPASASSAAPPLAEESAQPVPAELPSEGAVAQEPPRQQLAHITTSSSGATSGKTAKATKAAKAAGAAPNGAPQRPRVGPAAKRTISAALKHAALFSGPRTMAVDEETLAFFLELEEQASEAQLAQNATAEAPRLGEEEVEAEAAEIEDEEGVEVVVAAQDVAAGADSWLFPDAEEIVAAVTDPYMVGDE